VLQRVFDKHRAAKGANESEHSDDRRCLPELRGRQQTHQGDHRHEAQNDDNSLVEQAGDKTANEACADSAHERSAHGANVRITVVCGTPA
jgi:hypothetical protein